MQDKTNPRDSVQKVPDTATTYERAKPEQESPSKALSTPPADKPKTGDHLASGSNPSSKPAD